MGGSRERASLLKQAQLLKGGTNRGAVRRYVPANELA